MSKDPAFLFYSKDFYEGTRMMLPEERACYLDLLIYQHQNGFIPNDIKRLKMYCSGIDEATLQATLKAKFKQTEKGWYNEKIEQVILERKEYKSKQSENGKIGQFWKKCKAFLSKKDYEKIRKSLENVDNSEIFEFLKNKKLEKDTLKGSLKALLKHLEIKDAIEDVDVYEDKEKNEVENKKGGVGEKNKMIRMNDDMKEFIGLLSDYFLQTTEVQQMRVYGFLRTLGNDYENFKEQTKAYAQYKELTGEKIHNWNSYQTEWDRENWIKKLEREQNGKQDSKNQGGASTDLRRKTAERLGIV